MAKRLRDVCTCRKANHSGAPDAASSSATCRGRRRSCALGFSIRLTTRPRIFPVAARNTLVADGPVVAQGDSCEQFTGKRLAESTGSWSGPHESSPNYEGRWNFRPVIRTKPVSTWALNLPIWSWRSTITACRVMAKRLCDVCTCRKANALARRTPINFIVAADVSRLKLSLGRNNERTDVRCYILFSRATKLSHF